MHLLTRAWHVHGVHSQVLKADAAAMRALEGKTEEELFESEDFKAIKAANDKLERGLKYTYSLGARLAVHACSHNYPSMHPMRACPCASPHARGMRMACAGAGLVVLMQQCGLEPEKAIPLWCEKLGLNCVNALSRDYAYYKTQVGQMEPMLEMHVCTCASTHVRGACMACAQVSKMESMLEMFEQMKASSEKAAAARKEELANEASD